ncbi:hypothetical protein GDO86_018499 [Hymenochirus boettgeri]|uniref:Uncharacterized protein n=1 Tax=Hymenochirus boettgeri TaxID=247094 RepID=A0A8T2IDL6_9PIPI|nr:hypothetical protein GDO86_018499 [Hymenochirus boettgeri]
MAPVNHRKVVMLGYSSVGKSSLAIQFMKGDFPTDYEPTYANNWSKTFVMGGEEFELEVVDTAGQDEYSLLPQSFFIGIHGYIVVYSVDCSRSFQIAQTLYTILVDRRGKCFRKVTFEDGKKLAESWGAAFMEVSAKDPERSKQIFTKMIEEINRIERSFTQDKCCNVM